MSFQALVNSRVGVGLGLAVGRSVPSPMSYPLVNLLAGKLAGCEKRPLIQAIRNNQKVVQGQPLNNSELKKVVGDVLRFTGHCFVDLYRNFSNPKNLKKKIILNADLERLIDLSQDKKFGAFVVVPHMSSFDLMLLGAASLGLKTKVLTFGQPTGGYKLQNEIRALSGLDIMPVSRRTNLSALASLRQGGFVLTAVDRPIPGQKRMVNFFGRPSPLPDGHIRMALKADVPILAAAVHMNQDGLYQLQLSEPLFMQRLADSEEEVRRNAERVLSVLEGYIRTHPTQWQMFYPVWE